MKRKGFILLISAVLTSFLTFWSCNREVVPASEFTPYISAYTGGLVSPSSNILIELANEQTNIEPNTEVKSKLFSFSPSVKGKAFWLNNRTIEFIPENDALKSGTEYEVKFKLDKIVRVPKRLKTFAFTFRVEEKTGEIRLDSPDIVDPAFVNIHGEIRFNEVPEKALVEKALSAKTNDNQLFIPVVTTTESDGVFRFSIDKIARKKTNVDLTVQIDGKTLGLANSLSESITIPALDIFRVILAEQIYEPENGIQIVLTDPVSQSQDIRGLVTLSGISQYTYHVENNKIKLYFDPKEVGETTVKVDQGLRNTKEDKLESEFFTNLTIKRLNPQIELLSDGNILPNSEQLMLPFRAVNLYAVDIRIIKIFENNVLMFLQTNTLKGSDELRRSGRLIYKKTLRLDGDPSKNIHNWQRYAINLAPMIKQEPGAIYRVEFSFKQSYSAFDCGSNEMNGSLINQQEMLVRLQSDEISEKEEAYWDSPEVYYSNDDYDWELYKWSERDNPCHPSYYMSSEHKVSCNVTSSDLGVIAKSNSANQWWISVNNLLTTNPVSNVNINLYNYQLQSIGNAKTDGDGFAVIQAKGKAFALVAESGGQRTYLRLVEGEDNSLSRFDTGGKKIEKGLKGFIYGERGVWRPGDTLHISFILHDAEKHIPDNHPVSLEMYNARGQFHSKQIVTQGINGFYTYDVATQATDPTGLWNVYIKVGGTSFHKSFRVETIKPNRLKINLKLPENRLNASQGSVSATLSSAWLTGATARNLKAKVEMKLSKTTTQFKGFEKYIFNNPAADFTSETTEIFDGSLNDNGDVTFALKLPKAENAPGMLNAKLLARVFEPGGDASLYTQTIPFSPYPAYVGLNLNQAENRAIETDTDHRFDIVSLNSDGKMTNRNNIEYKIYKIDWSWWWENNGESLGNYINNSSYQPVASGKLQTVNGKANFKFKLKYPAWGRFLVYVKDKDSGHASGGTVFIDWPEYRGRGNKSDPDHIKMLTFSTDKPSYEIGEEITVIIPAAAEGKALVAVENGSTVLSRTWVDVSGKDTKYIFKATKEMAPNTYIHISLLQPHAQTVNDLPIRMYGIAPVTISNKESVLEPQIKMPDVLRPETEFTVEVSEQKGKAMTYTLAVVDDGLLDLTNFKTPNPWMEFYAREALGIRTWDIYDFVMGAFGGKYAAMFSIGGDETLNPADEKAKRFKPVVKFYGPFTLGKGDTKKHKITLPLYVGSVRTMVVAGQDGAFGKTEKTTPVRTPLMVLSSLPRVLSVNEKISLPVNVFAMENDVKSATVKIETSGLLQNTSSAQTVYFDKPGDAMVYFNLKTSSKTGVEHITITATSGGKTAKESLEIEIRNPNPRAVFSDNKVLNAGESATFNYHLTGSSNDDWVKMEIARIPSVDISRRFDFLYNYQHCCSEQLTSCALPLLYVSQFKETDKSENETIKNNIREAIKNLYGRQAANGGIVYWPGNVAADEWVTSYAGIFLVLAKEKGYDVNSKVLTKWTAFQRKAAQNWSPNASRYSEYLQAYRLYSLSIAGAPEWGAMNRLKERSDLSVQANWCLAAAYATGGKTKPADELIFNQPTQIDKYWNSYTYGSSDRDEALILQTLVLMNRMTDAFKQAQKVSKNLTSEDYFNTQSTAFSLMAMGMLAEKTAGVIECDWTLNGKKQDNIRSAKAIYQAQLPKTAQGEIRLTNTGKGVAYVNVVSKYRPTQDTLPEISRNLRLDVSYTDLKGNAINVSELLQGTDFKAVIKITNTSLSDNYENLALTQIIPAGWEIFNDRLTTDSDGGFYTYRDIRDDRVLTYFDLSRAKSITFTVRLQAVYLGLFTLPAVQCEAMYDTSAQARTTAGQVRVVK